MRVGFYFELTPSSTFVEEMIVVKVADIMQVNVVSVQPDTTLGSAIETLCRYRISGAPVVLPTGELVGIVSEYALMDVLFEPSLKQSPVSQSMTREVHTLAEDDSLTRVVHMFSLYGVRRLPVLRNGKLAGIVSRRDLLLLSAKLSEPIAEPLQELMSEPAPATRETPLSEDTVRLLDLV